MAFRGVRPVPILLAGGLLAFALTGVSIVDMFLPRPHDGVVVESDIPGRLFVREVVPGSGAAEAGIHPGDRIVGIARQVLRSSSDAAALLQQYRIGDRLPYLLETEAGHQEVEVELGPRRIGDLTYLSACLLGFAFFVVGSFVLLKKPTERAGHVFFILCTLFLLFLVCRLRPASYSWVDHFVLNTGTLALLFLPGAFLHFFLIFPRPAWRSLGLTRRATPSRTGAAALAALYLLPVAIYLLTLGLSRARGLDLSLISGAPTANWWVLAIYMLLGMAVLAINARRLTKPRERRGVLLVLFGAVFGLFPFLVTAVAFPSFLHTARFLLFGVGPLSLVPLTFAYAIVRFGLLDIRVILRKSLLYTATSALITGLYALGIGFFTAFSRGTQLADSRYFPLVFALAIVLLFEPLRRRLQGPVDRFFSAGRSRLQQAMLEMGEAFAERLDLEAVVRDLVERLPQQLGLHFAALYLSRGDGLERTAGPQHLPAQLPDLPLVHRYLQRRGSLLPLEELEPLQLRVDELSALLGQLGEAGVEVVGDLSTRRRHLGMVVLSGKSSQVPLDSGELDLLRGLLSQAAIGLENSLLLEERTQQAELERELEIAARIQASLLPKQLRFAPGWEVAARCHPARHVGGDFFAELPSPENGSYALVYGDVSGKSVSGAMLMMAAQETLHSFSMVHRDPCQLMSLANRRLYRLQRRSFVALGYLAVAPGGESLRYSLAGQPNLLRRGIHGAVEELPLPERRIPLGAMANSTYELLEVPVRPGELIVGCSDGVLEARSPSGEFFGSHRLVEALARGPNDPAGAVGALLEALSRFTRGGELYDDLTLIALARAQECQ